MKVAFIINHSHEVSAWYAKTIDAVIESNQHEVFFIYIPIVERKTKRSVFYRLFNRFEDRYFKLQYDALKVVNIEPQVKEKVVVHIDATSLLLNDEQLQYLAQLQLDVIYTINFSIKEKENISSISRFGLAYVQSGYGVFINSQPPAFWEVMESAPITGGYLLMRKNCEDFILYEGTSTTKLFSVKSNCNHFLWKAATYLYYRLQYLEKVGSSCFDKKLITQKPFKNVPTTFAMPGLFLKNALNYIKHKIRVAQANNFFSIYYSFAPFNFEQLDYSTFQRLSAPIKSFYADPFVFKKENKNYIFFEELNADTNKGHISLIEVKGNDSFSAPVKVLERPYHLSYPFVFEKGGTYYMIPETSANKTIELYVADSFPFNWSFKMNLMENVSFIDATIVFHNGKWWLFANGLDGLTSENDQLFLFYSDELLSQSWTLHPQNPIATHAENCRPAGRIFSMNGKLYRPAQNNASQQYGFGIKINEIEVLNEKEYREKEIKDLNPKQFGFKATHQIDFSSDMIVIDGIR